MRCRALTWLGRAAPEFYAQLFANDPIRHGRMSGARQVWGGAMHTIGSDASSNTSNDLFVKLDRLRAGDEGSWRILSNMFRQRLRELAQSRLPAEIASRVDASDVVQETLVEANQSIAAFQGRSLPELFAWMAAILNHNVTDAVREHLVAECRAVSSQWHSETASKSANGWQATCVADQTSPSMAAAREEAQQQLLAAITDLPPRQRDAVRMRHLESRPLAEIAAHLGCTPQAAAAVIARGLRSLRDALPHLDLQVANYGPRK